METLTTFYILLGILGVSLIVGFIYHRYSVKRYPSATAIDRTLWKIQIMSFCIGGAIYIFSGLLPFHAHPVHIYPEDSQETKIQKLIDQDEDNREIINRLRDTTYMLIVAVAIYLMSVGGFLSAVRAQRNAELLANNPDTKKPFGL